MSEDLKQAGGNQNLETAAEVDLRLAQPAHVYDLRTGQYFGHTQQIHLRLDPWRPSLFALLDQPVTATNLVEFLSRKAVSVHGR